MEIKIIKDQISKDEIKNAAQNSFGEMVKAVVDIEQEIMTLGGELHADGEALLLEQGSEQENLWGINIYPYNPDGQRIEFTALINIRPSRNNKTMEIQDKAIRSKIQSILQKLIKR